MNEEFQTLMDTWRYADKTLQGGARRQLLAVLTQILCEVPRWKVPAAPSLVKDPIVLGRAVAQSGVFYNEILALPLPNKPLPSRVGAIGKKKVMITTKEDLLNHQLNDLDAAIMSFYSK
jgi:hypothetical protein